MLHRVLESLRSELVLFDGSMGARLMSMTGLRFRVPEELNLTNPDIIEEISMDYIDAGAMVVETNTFGASRNKLKDFGLEDRQRDIIISAVSSCRRAAGEKIAVLGCIGPTGLLPKPIGNSTFRDFLNEFSEQIGYMKDAGVDGVIIETMSHLKEVQAAMIAAREAGLPFIITITLEENGKTLHGSTPEVFADMALKHGALAIGFNCSLGPSGFLKPLDFIMDCPLPIGIQANAGLPRSGKGGLIFPLDPHLFAEGYKPLLDKGLNFLGGCCGTTNEHIKVLSSLIRGYKPRHIPKRQEVTTISSYCSLIKIGRTEPIKVIGERINPTARKKLKDALLEGNWEVIIDEAIEQMHANADALDINVGVPLSDEVSLMHELLLRLETNIPVPLSIDTSNDKALEEALMLLTASPLVNSLSGKEKDLEERLPIIARFRTPFIALPIDDKGIPETAEERLMVLERIIASASALGLDKSFILSDGLVMTLSTNQHNILETLKTIRLARDELGLSGILGISNVSYGLPQRRYINATFLAMAAGYGLDAVIANPLAEETPWIISSSNAISGRDLQLRVYTSLYAKVKEEVQKPIIIKGLQEPDFSEILYKVIRKGLDEPVRRLVEGFMNDYKPTAILNEGLMPAMKGIGLLYEKGEIYLPQLMMSAKAMEAALSVLKPSLIEELKSGDAKSTNKRIVLASVRGDIHDIGKNLVALLLRSFGLEVIDLGKDVPFEKIIAKAFELDADVIGLSALMTTTMMEMERVVNAKVKQGLRSKVLIGGAVITEEFALQIGADGYGKDAIAAVKFIEKEIG